MSILKLLEQAQGGQGLTQLASQFGLDADQAQGLTEMLAPTLGSAAKQRAEKGGVDGLIGSLMGEAQGGLFDNAGAAASDEGRAQGQHFLEQLLGGQSEAEGLAQEAANRAGIDTSIVSQFLPALAAMMQGGLQKNMPDASLQAMASSTGQSGGLAGLVGGLLGGRDGGAGGLGPLMQMLDADGDGSPLDDILSKFMK